jgi:hypothetical protein
MATDPRFNAMVKALGTYFDGLYESDAKKLATVFHPQARYACGTEGTLTNIGMGEYFPIVDARPSPASRLEPRADRIVSIEFAGPVTAMARVECVIGPKKFTDFLTFIFVEGRWQIIAKVFHFDLKPLS